MLAIGDWKGLLRLLEERKRDGTNVFGSSPEQPRCLVGKNLISVQLGNLSDLCRDARARIVRWSCPVLDENRHKGQGQVNQLPSMTETACSGGCGLLYTAPTRLMTSANMDDRDIKAYGLEGAGEALDLSTGYGRRSSSRLSIQNIPTTAAAAVQVPSHHLNTPAATQHQHIVTVSGLGLEPVIESSRDAVVGQRGSSPCTGSRLSLGLQRGSPIVQRVSPVTHKGSPAGRSSPIDQRENGWSDCRPHSWEVPQGHSTPTRPQNSFMSPHPGDVPPLSDIAESGASLATTMAYTVPTTGPVLCANTPGASKSTSPFTDMDLLNNVDSLSQPAVSMSSPNIFPTMEATRFAALGPMLPSHIMSPSLSLYDSPATQAALSPVAVSLGTSLNTIMNRKRRHELLKERREREPSTTRSTVSSASDSDELEAKKPKAVPEEKKDEAYWERRRKNNEAAKRSRDARRQKEEEIAVRAAYLEQENLKLRAQVAILKNETAKLHYLLYNRR